MKARKGYLVVVLPVQVRGGEVHLRGCDCAQKAATKANSAEYVSNWGRVFGGEAKEAQA